MKNGWISVLEAAAQACAGEESGCCDVREKGEPCCMTDSAKYVFEMMAAAGGPTLEQCEAIARGEMVVMKVQEEDFRNDNSN